MGYSEIFVRPDGAACFPSFGQLLWTHDRGESWTSVSTSANTGARALSLYGRTGLLAGPQGMCAVSNDSGRTWTKIEQSRNSIFVTAELIDESTGYIGGPNSVLLYTRDAGQTWSKELLSKSFHVMDMCRVENRLYAVGSEGTILFKLLK